MRGWRAGAAMAAAGGDHDPDPGIHTFLPPTTSHADTDPDISKIWLTCPRNIIIYRYHLTIANPA